ncbi:MAG TPA: L,D-transpeptidase family protein [Gemmatimonadota bacterium]|nr:L,D-transpeptidase family protein [Gemmatimonadota bacterium]
MGRGPRRLARGAALGLVTSAASVAGAVAQGGPAEEVAGGSAARPIREIIRTRIEAGTGAVAPVMIVQDERIHAATELPLFYESRGFLPAWVTEDGPTAAADSALRAIEEAEREGLEPTNYHLRRIRSVYADARRARRADSVPDRTRLADLDLLLTDAFLLYGAHLVGGVVDPVTMHPEWTASRREADLVALLDSALSTGRIRAALQTLLPRHPAYLRLREALHRYRMVAAAGGWPELGGATLRLGSEGPDVAPLRRRLVLAGDLAAGPPGQEDHFDEQVEEAVRRFQRRHGLPQDGVAGLETTGIMNTPVEERIRAIVLNMERWRWLPRDLGQRHILVNIAGFALDVVDGDSTVFTSRVMVGHRYRKTPVFSDRMTYLVLSPTWTIPPNILEQDKLPLIRSDPGYLRAHRIRVLAPDGSEVDPRTVDWSTITGTTRLRFRMDAGPENPLGRVKFMFPNAHHVYLHDTPDHELFDRAARTFSSGCIRVERPFELAALLLRDQPAWTPARIETVVRGGVERTIPLARPIPVHLLYWTAWAEPDGSIHFRRDIYDRDPALDEALRIPPPVAAADGRGPAEGARPAVFTRP